MPPPTTTQSKTVPSLSARTVGALSMRGRLAIDADTENAVLGGARLIRRSMRNACCRNADFSNCTLRL